MATAVKSEHLESNVSSKRSHCHLFYLGEKEITCDKPGTILRALESSVTFKDLRENKTKKQKKEEKDNIKKPEKGINFIINWNGMGNIANHFPCWLIKEGDKLNIKTLTENIEETVLPNNKETEEYVTFSVETQGGKNTKTKQILREQMLDKYGPLCVYAKAMESVKEALRNDGRFTEIVFDQRCELTECKTITTVSIEQIAKNLDRRSFKICLTKPKEKKTKETKNTETLEHVTNTDSKPRTNTSDVGEESSKTKKKSSSQSMLDYAEINHILHNQFKELVKNMESRWGQKKTFAEELHLIKENFGKIRQEFSEVYKLKELMKLGDSVCEVIVTGYSTGTGFVLFDNYILTNAHLFEKSGISLKQELPVDVFVKFNREHPSGVDILTFKVKTKVIKAVMDNVLDYAVLEIDHQTVEEQKKVPPGLLNICEPAPARGGACLIGHPGGELKQMEITSIICFEEKREAVDKYKRDNGHAIFTINEALKNEKEYLEHVIKDKEKVTYHTSFFHGSSGSPVFSNQCKVIGIHSGGFEYQDERTNTKQSVIEYAFPILPILENLVLHLEQEGMQDVMNKLKKEAEKNKYLVPPTNE